MEPLIQVYKIENGFLIEHQVEPGAERQLHYCKDAKDIAEEIIAMAARTKLGIEVTTSYDPSQQEMFTRAQMAPTSAQSIRDVWADDIKKEFTKQSLTTFKGR
jgi:hypothetical protein